MIRKLKLREVKRPLESAKGWWPWCVFFGFMFLFFGEEDCGWWVGLWMVRMGQFKHTIYMNGCLKFFFFFLGGGDKSFLWVFGLIIF